MKILLVCTGNICRSPMAEALLRHLLEERGCRDIEVSSAGTWATSGAPASSNAATLLSQRGLSLSEHASRPLERPMLEDAALVLAMTSVHRREIVDLLPNAAGKVVLVKEIAELESYPVPDGASRDERLQALFGAARPESRRALDLDDPIGLPVSAYERCLAEIEAGLTALVDVLCPHQPPK